MQRFVPVDSYGTSPFPRGFGGGGSQELHKIATARSERDEPGAAVFRIRAELKVSSCFELPEQVIRGLLADTGLLRQLPRAHVRYGRIAKEGDLRWLEVGIAGRNRRRIQACAERLPRQAE